MARSLAMLVSAGTLVVSCELELRSPALAQQANAPPVAPHAWLYGAWTGGLFPAPLGLTAQICLAQPVVIFTRDVVLRGSIIEETYAQRLIETVRTDAVGLEFRFTSDHAPQTTSLLGLSAPPTAVGFGCPGPDTLNVQRRGENEIAFPGCADFPYPLIRCPAR
jgi:hypothetical protein